MRYFFFHEFDDGDRSGFRPLPACPAGTQDLKLVTPSSTRPLPCPACLAGSQVRQRCSCFIAQNFPCRLDKPTGAASCSFPRSNYKSSARARQAGTGRDQLSPKKRFDRLLFVAHPRLCPGCDSTLRHRQRLWRQRMPLRRLLPQLCSIQDLVWNRLPHRHESTSRRR